KELVQRLLLPLLAKPQRLAGLQIANHRQEFAFLARYNSSTPMRRNAGFRRLAFHRSRYRRSIARTVLPASPIRRPTCRADALSHARPTASSKRLLNGA